MSSSVALSTSSIRCISIAVMVSSQIAKITILTIRDKLIPYSIGLNATDTVRTPLSWQQVRVPVWIHITTDYSGQSGVGHTDSTHTSVATDCSSEHFMHVPFARLTFHSNSILEKYTFVSVNQFIQFEVLAKRDRWIPPLSTITVILPTNTHTTHYKKQQTLSAQIACIHILSQDPSRVGK
jgi:hypothetical protein